jgi:hypothetical protein
MQLVQVVYRYYEVRSKWWLCRWDARTKKLGGGRGLPRQTENQAAHARRAIDRKVWGRWPNVNARVDVGVEVVGRYGGDNKQPAACSKLNQ